MADRLLLRIRVACPRDGHGGLANEQVRAFRFPLPFVFQQAVPMLLDFSCLDRRSSGYGSGLASCTRRSNASSPLRFYLLLIRGDSLYSFVGQKDTAPEQAADSQAALLQAQRLVWS